MTARLRRKIGTLEIGAHSPSRSRELSALRGSRFGNRRRSFPPVLGGDFMSLEDKISGAAMNYKNWSIACSVLGIPF